MRRVGMLEVLFVLLVSPLSTGVAKADSGQDWHMDGMVDGVQVERRDVAGSHFDELRLSLVSRLPLDRLCEAIYPKALGTKPEPRFKKQELLKQTETERWTYEQVSVPVVSDRDYVMHVKLNRPASTGRCDVSFETVEDPSRPPVHGFVRIPVIRGHWNLAPTVDGRVLVRYEIFSEPGGAVPAFLARGGQKSAAVDFMKIILARASVAPSAPGANPSPPVTPATSSLPVAPASPAPPAAASTPSPASP